MLILAGETYLTRLWCVVEVFTYVQQLEMKDTRANSETGVDANTQANIPPVNDDHDGRRRRPTVQRLSAKRLSVATRPSLRASRASVEEADLASAVPENLRYACVLQALPGFTKSAIRRFDAAECECAVATDYVRLLGCVEAASGTLANFNRRTRIVLRACVWREPLSVSTAEVHDVRELGAGNQSCECGNGLDGLISSSPARDAEPPGLDAGDSSLGASEIAADGALSISRRGTKPLPRSAHGRRYGFAQQLLKSRGAPGVLVGWALSLLAVWAWATYSIHARLARCAQCPTLVPVTTAEGSSAGGVWRSLHDDSGSMDGSARGASQLEWLYSNDARSPGMPLSLTEARNACARSGGWLAAPRGTHDDALLQCLAGTRAYSGLWIGIRASDGRQGGDPSAWMHFEEGWQDADGHRGHSAQPCDEPLGDEDRIAGMGSSCPPGWAPGQPTSSEHWHNPIDESPHAHDERCTVLESVGWVARSCARTEHYVCSRLRVSR